MQPQKLRTPRFLRRFGKSRDGVAAVEFAIVAAPFFAILFAIFETAFVFYADLMLDTGLAQAARMVRTGQAQTAGFDETAFRDSVCDKVYGFIDCTAGLEIDVRSFPNFDDVTVPDPLDVGGNLQTNFTYDPGSEGDVVVARAFFEWNLLTPMPYGSGLGNMSSGNRLLIASATFRNEPFGP
ncbi:MAG: TadE/TadG family type IV pilus assembly protein [Alphaproteobacteria bacterium]